jgi:hypothetical protein
MPVLPLKSRSLRLAPLFALMLTACAANSPPPSAGVEPPKIPSPPVSNEDLTPGIYWTMVCTYRSSLQAKLKLSLPTLEQCATTPPASPAP